MSVAIGRCVDEHQKPFGVGAGGPVIAAILGTDIDRRIARYASARQDVVELRRIVV